MKGTYPCRTSTAAYIYFVDLYLQPWKKPILSRDPIAEWSFHAF